MNTDTLRAQAAGNWRGILVSIGLPDVRELTIYCDHDPHGQGLLAGRELADRAMQAGITCRIWMSKQEGQDPLDELNRIKAVQHG